MPFVEYEEGSVPEGMEVADVVPRADLDAVTSERDRLADQLSVTMEDLNATKAKFAKAVMTSAERVKREQGHDVRRDSGPQTFAQLFKAREGM